MFASLRPAEVLAAAHRIAPHVRRTRLVRSTALGAIAGTDVFLKLENEQITGSFKLRGALNVLATLEPAVRARGVVASSAGNHGLGVAYAARKFVAPAKIFVPVTAPEIKRQGIVSYGADIDASRPHYDAAMAAAIEWAAATQSTFINPCAGEMLLAGQGTVAHEILSEIPRLGTLIVSVGGGGLLGGCASLIRAVSPTTRIIGAQSENTSAMTRSVRAGKVVEIENLPTLADGLAGQIDEGALDIGRHALDDMAVASEEDIGRAIVWLDRTHGTQAEGAGAAGVAALLAGVAGTLVPPVVVVVSGGNIDRDRLDGLRARHARS